MFSEVATTALARTRQLVATDDLQRAVRERHVNAQCDMPSAKGDRMPFGIRHLPFDIDSEARKVVPVQGLEPRTTRI